MVGARTGGATSFKRGTSDWHVFVVFLKKKKGWF